MKKFIITLATALTLMVAFTACNRDPLDPESVIVADKVEYTPFDYWLEANFVNTYNIDFKYRYEDIQSDFNYYTVPARYENSIILAHLVKYLCLEAYDEAGGIEFTRANFPKMIYCIGDWEYRNNGTYILGTAEGGHKILLAGVNYLSSYVDSPSDLNHYYFKTIHHEFTHILNQTKDMPTAFQFVTGTGYVADEWSTENFDSGYLGRGFISSYAQHSHGEDFAEMLSIYVCYPQSQWDAWMEQAAQEAIDNETGVDPVNLIDQKLGLVKKYMEDSWGINLDDLRNAVQTRQANIAAGKIDLTDIELK